MSSSSANLFKPVYQRTSLELKVIKNLVQEHLPKVEAYFLNSKTAVDCSTFSVQQLNQYTKENKAVEVFQVNAAFVGHVVNPAHYQISVDLADFAGKFAKITYAYSNEEQFGRKNWLVTMHLKDERCLYFLARANENVNLLLRLLELIVPNDRVEKFILPAGISVPYPLTFWGKHTIVEWDRCPTIATAYTKLVHPTVLEDFKVYVISEAKKAEKNEIFVMDVGGGKGTLAEELIKLAAKHQIKLNYILLEPVAEQARDASTTVFKKYPECVSQILIAKLSDFYAYKNGSVFAQYRGAIDCVISSGGPLNDGVVTRADAEAHLEIFNQLLTKNGRLIAVGATPLTVYKEDFVKSGFTLFSMIKKFENLDTIQNYVGGKVAYQKLSKP